MKKILLILTLAFTQSCEFRYVVAANFSKEYCSCIFVVKRSETNCFEQAKQFVSPSFELNRELKEVSASFLLARTSAKFSGMKYGCILERSYLDR